MRAAASSMRRRTACEAMRRAMAACAPLRGLSDARTPVPSHPSFRYLLHPHAYLRFNFNFSFQAHRNEGLGGESHTR